MCLSGDTEGKYKYGEATEWYSYITFVIKFLTDGVYCSDGVSEKPLSDIAPVKWDGFGPKDGLASKEVYIFDQSLIGKSFKAGDEVAVSGKIVMLYGKDVSERPWYKISVGGDGCGCVDSSSSSRSDSSHSHPFVPSSGDQSGSSSPECAEFDMAEELPCFNVPSVCVCDSVRQIDLADYLPGYDFHVVATKAGVYCKPIPVELTYTIISSGYYRHEVSVYVDTPTVMRDDHMTYVFEGDFVAAGELLYIPYVYIIIKYDAVRPIMCEAPLSYCKRYPEMLMCIGSKRPAESSSDSSSSYSSSESSSSESSSYDSSSSSGQSCDNCAEYGMLPYSFSEKTSTGETCYDFILTGGCMYPAEPGKHTVLDAVIGFQVTKAGKSCVDDIADFINLEVACADPDIPCTTTITQLGRFTKFRPEWQPSSEINPDDYEKIDSGVCLSKGDMVGFALKSTMNLTETCKVASIDGVMRPDAWISVTMK